MRPRIPILIMCFMLCAFAATRAALAAEENATGETREAVAPAPAQTRAPDAGSGVVNVSAACNGEPFEAFIEVYPAGGGERALTAFSESGERAAKLVLPGGAYDIRVKNSRAGDKPVRAFENVAVKPGREAKIRADFASGTLEVSVTLRGDEIPCRVSILDNVTERPYCDGTFRPGAPATFSLSPGRYVVRVTGEGPEGMRFLASVNDVAVAAGRTQTRTVEAAF